DVVRRIPITAVHRQVFSPWHALDQRNTDLAKTFFHVEARARHGQRLATVSEQIADLEFAADVLLNVFRPILATESDADGILCPRRLDAILAEVAAQRTTDDLLFGVAC